MHILLLPSWYPVSANDLNGTFFRQQAQALARAGVRVGVAAPVFRSLRGEFSSLWCGPYGRRSCLEHGVVTHIHHSMLFFPRLPYLDRCRWLAAGEALFEAYAAEHGRPDVLHAHCLNYGGILAERIARRHHIPFVVTEHSSTYARGLIRPWQQKAMRQAAEAAAVRLAVSRPFCRLLERFFPGTDWQYLPNMLDNLFTAAPLPDKTPERPFAFCAVGHLHRHKGFDIVLDAFALAAAQIPGITLHIGGSGSEAAALAAQAGRLNIENAVTFHGALSRQGVQDLMRRCDAFVLASRAETFGIVLIEALSQGLPLAATANDGPRSVITPESGLLVPNDDPAALARAMIALCRNRAAYPPHTLRAGALAEFGESAVIGQLLAHYRNAV
ncbi:glycosyltransferase [Neisseria leonii]|uniref:Glycosyltransferase n=1 Tax=Neisseria leonii TaxID=2995413 RepID=A0A9X4E742_9NEIS|nr:glycosyltransferase [Neisseria sp. 51.81]MDD9328367.1 glycosyltransferase [Neisseria sp. 51.81]